MIILFTFKIPTAYESLPDYCLRCLEAHIDWYRYKLEFTAKPRLVVALKTSNFIPLTRVSKPLFI